MVDLGQFDEQLLKIDSRIPLSPVPPKQTRTRAKVRWDRLACLLVGLTLGAILGAGHLAVAVAAGVAWVGALMLARDWARGEAR